MDRGTQEAPAFSAPSPDLQFLASESNIYEYANLYYFAARLAEYTRDLSFSEERPLLICSESSDETVFLMAACFLLKIPFFTISSDIREGELDAVLSDVSPSLIFTDNEDRFSDLEGARFFTPEQKWLTREAFWKSELFTLGEPEFTAGLFLTSGSTGTPKIVPVKRRQIFYAAAASAKNFRTDENRYWLLCLPLNHIGGVSILLRSLLYNSALFRMDQFNVEDVRIFLSENPLFEAASLVPTMLLRVLEDPLFQIHSGIKAILLGGGPISSELINEAAKRGLPVVASYGMTETCAQICANPLQRPSGVYYPKSSVGPVFEPNQIEIRDDNGKVLPPIEDGLIWLKGPQVFDGYLNKELNEDVFDTSGWFNTGDYGHLNRYGHLFVSTRRTDRIVTGGENVSPVQVEEILSKAEGVKECAVLGVPDKIWGQKVVALVVPEKEMPDADYLHEHMQQSLEKYQIPKEYLRVTSLPATSLGKIKRSRLPEIYNSLKQSSL
jgi:o-succinylbenzoate---CoA ligase